MISQFLIFFAGLGPLIAANAVWISLIGAAVAFSIWSPVFKTTARYAALLGAVALLAYNIGVKHEYKRMEAQRVLREEHFNKQLKEARRKAVSTVARRNQPGWLRNKPKVDQYDRNP